VALGKVPVLWIVYIILNRDVLRIAHICSYMKRPYELWPGVCARLILVNLNYCIKFQNKEKEMTDNEFKVLLTGTIQKIEELCTKLNINNIDALALIAILQNYHKDILFDDLINKWDTQYYQEIDKITLEFSESLKKQKANVESMLEKKGVEIIKKSML